MDLRWGITESQSTRRETLKLCLDEIRTCRFLVGLLGERYGSIPGDDALTADLREEQPWLAGLRGRSMTELRVMKSWLRLELASRSPLASPRSLLSTLVDCADDLLTPETEVRALDVEW